MDQPWFMGELAGRGAAGHCGFTGTSVVLDPVTDTYLVLLANAVHPRRRGGRQWASGPGGDGGGGGRCGGLGGPG
ncbi:hypothetical protein GCM10020256_55190 [Streptomyces thermocoprophilus]